MEKSLKHICAQADRELSNGKTSKQLEELAEQWIGEGKDEDGENKIGAYRLSDKKAHMLVVVERIEYMKGSKPDIVEYDILRFFVVAGKWHVSCDLQGADVKKMVQMLLDKQ